MLRRMRFHLTWLAASLWLGLAACSDPAQPAGDAAPLVDAAAGRPDSSFPPPRDDLVPRIGSDDAIDIATWNLEHFPLESGTPRLVADLITSMDLDLVAVQEIEDTDAFDELVERLRDFDAIVSSHTYGNGSYQKIGFLYRRDVVQLSGGALLFGDRGYVFPRPPLQAIVTAVSAAGEPFDFVAITLHLKAGRDAEDRERRHDAVRVLEDHVRELVASVDEDVILLGDFNEVVTTDEGTATLAPLLDATRYRMHTAPLAEAGAATFLPSSVVLDHVVSTAALADELAGGDDEIPDLEDQLGGYRSVISDHLPVVVSVPVL